MESSHEIPREVAICYPVGGGPRRPALRGGGGGGGGVEGSGKEGPAEVKAGPPGFEETSEKASLTPPRKVRGIVVVPRHGKAKALARRGLGHENFHPGIGPGRHRDGKFVLPQGSTLLSGRPQ